VYPELSLKEIPGHKGMRMDTKKSAIYVIGNDRFIKSLSAHPVQPGSQLMQNIRVHHKRDLP
jgi:hypothetical protein